MWRNAFDLGECRVEVYCGTTGFPKFSSVMQKGDSETFQIGGNEGTTTVSISSAGEVSIEQEGYQNLFMEVRVVPLYSHDYPVRLSGVVFDEDTSDAYASVNNDDGYVDYVNLFPAAPDPCILTNALGDHEYIALWATPDF